MSTVSCIQNNDIYKIIQLPIAIQRSELLKKGRQQSIPVVEKRDILKKKNNSIITPIQEETIAEFGKPVEV